MTCHVCESKRRLVEQAESALAHAGKELKRLNQMTYSEVASFEQKAAPLKRELSTAKSNLTRHRNKCGVTP